MRKLETAAIWLLSLFILIGCGLPINSSLNDNSADPTSRPQDVLASATTISLSPTVSTTFILGAYTSTIRSIEILDKELQQNAGVWRIVFRPQHKYEAFFDGTSITTGTYTLQGNWVIFSDNAVACANKGPGTYIWVASEKELTFTTVGDACAERKLVMTMHPFTRIP